MPPILNKWTCLGRSVRPEQVGARFGFGSGSRPLVLIELELSGHQALNQVDLSGQVGRKVWVWVWLEAFNFLQREPWLHASNAEQMDMSDGC